MVNKLNYDDDIFKRIHFEYNLETILLIEQQKRIRIIQRCKKKKKKIF